MQENATGCAEPNANFENEAAEKEQRWKKRVKIVFGVVGAVAAGGFLWWGLSQHAVPPSTGKAVSRALEKSPAAGSAAADAASQAVEAISNNYGSIARMDLTGEKLTPTEIAAMIGRSPHAVNRVLCELGLQERQPNGGWMPTDAGSYLGKPVDKVTRWGYPFQNIEWDKATVDLVEEKICAAAA